MIYHAPFPLWLRWSEVKPQGGPGSCMLKMAEPLAAGSLNECVEEGHLASRMAPVRLLLCETSASVVLGFEI